MNLDSLNNKVGLLEVDNVIADCSEHCFQQYEENMNTGAVENCVTRVVDNANNVISNKNKVCNFYLVNRWCKFGRNCRYLHAKPELKNIKSKTDKIVIETKCKDNIENSGNLIITNNITTLESECSSVENSLNEKNKLQKRIQNIDDSDKEHVHVSLSNNKLLNVENYYCKFYMKGYCRLGSHCRFIHDKDHRSIVRNKLKKEKKIITAKLIDNKSVCAKAAKQNNVLRATNPIAAEEKSKRAVEIEQLLKRFPELDKSETIENSTFNFKFASSDPDWPYDVKEIDVQYTLPLDYPKERLVFNILDDGILPETLRKRIEEAGNTWIDEKRMKNEDDLLIRPMLKWLDNNLENLFTKALTLLKLERQAMAAGLQFIPAHQLQKLYPGSKSNAEQNPSPDNSLIKTDLNDDSKAVLQKCEDKENLDVGNGKLIHEELRSLSQQRKGTELSFRDLHFSTDTIASISTNILALLLSCGRCNRKFDIKLQRDKESNMVCIYCKQAMQCKLRLCLVFESSHVIGYVDTQNCNVIDVILPDCIFTITCLECTQDSTIGTLAAGQPNNTWCQHCHKKFTMVTNNIKIVKLSDSSITNFKGEIKEVGVAKKIKAIKDQNIQEGLPLPEYGICRHFKKSFRWFRFPCCGKAYPCDLCHEDKEDHEMKLANRMICGFCAHEQPYSNDKPCNRCSHNMTNKATSHWEGGKGCRDVIKMSRNDSKKYKGASSKETNTKATKLRHST